LLCRADTKACGVSPGDAAPLDRMGDASASDRSFR